MSNERRIPLVKLTEEELNAVAGGEYEWPSGEYIVVACPSCHLQMLFPMEKEDAAIAFAKVNGCPSIDCDYTGPRYVKYMKDGVVMWACYSDHI